MLLTGAALLAIAPSSQAQTGQTPQQWAEAQQKAREAEWARQKAEQERQAAERQRREAERIAAEEKIRLEQLAERERRQQQIADTQRQIEKNLSAPSPSSRNSRSAAASGTGCDHCGGGGCPVCQNDYYATGGGASSTPRPSAPRAPEPSAPTYNTVDHDGIIGNENLPGSGPSPYATNSSPYSTHSSPHPSPAADPVRSGREALDAFLKATTADSAAPSLAINPSAPPRPAGLPRVDPESGLVPWNGRDPYGFDTPDALQATPGSPPPTAVNADGLVVETGPVVPGYASFGPGASAPVTPYDLPPLDPPPPPEFDPADDGRAYIWNQEEQLYYKAVKDWQRRFDEGSATYRDHPDRLGLAATAAGKKSDPSWGGITQKGDMAYAYWDELRRRDATTARDIQTERDLSAGLVRANLTSDQERYVRVFAMSRAQQQGDLTGLSMHAVMDMDGPAYRAKVDALRHSTDALARKYHPASISATAEDRAIDQVMEKTRRDWYSANHYKYAEPVPKHATPYDPQKNAHLDALNPPPQGPNPALLPADKR